MKYRLAVPDIEAWQNVPDSLTPEWMQGRYSGTPGQLLHIDTGAGHLLRVEPQDWVLANANRRYLAVQTADAFKVMYEAVDQTAS